MTRVERLNQVLDHAIKHYGFRSDTQLAHFLGVNPSTIWRWRQGAPTSQLTDLLLDFIDLGTPEREPAETAA